MVMPDWADKIADEITEQQRSGIARAIREERERCAKIAEDHAAHASSDSIDCCGKSIARLIQSR
jgi:hypothetical protein